MDGRTHAPVRRLTALPWAAMRTSMVLGGLGLLLFASGCGTSTRRFALRAPMARDTDLAPVYVPCRDEEDDKDKTKK